MLHDSEILERLSSDLVTATRRFFHRGARGVTVFPSWPEDRSRRAKVVTLGKDSHVPPEVPSRSNQRQPG